MVATIAGAAARSGARVLDVHTDPDHNRSVLTLAAPPAPLVEGLLAAALAARDASDLREHRGVHPRLGAIDVVPLVALAGADLPVAVRAAASLASRLWEVGGIPSFLYGHASPAGLSLPMVRQRAFAGLEPSVGGPGPHTSAGAAAVGARGVLVAYNVNLASDDLGAARDIARAVRESNGGLPHLRALGLALPSRGIVQVSMNLTEPLLTTVEAAFSAVVDLAAARGIAVLESELVGLVPRRALPASPDDFEALLLRQPPKTLEAMGLLPHP